MPQHAKKTIKDRLARAKGHLNAVSTMLEEKPDCIAIVQQIQAVNAAVGKVSEAVLENYLHQCVENEGVWKEPSALAARIREIFNAASAKYTLNAREQNKS